jgi:hypothetical protein
VKNKYNAVIAMVSASITKKAIKIKKFHGWMQATPCNESCSLIYPKQQKAYLPCSLFEVQAAFMSINEQFFSTSKKQLTRVKFKHGQKSCTYSPPDGSDEIWFLRV